MNEYDGNVSNDTGTWRTRESLDTTSEPLRFYLNPKYAVLENLDFFSYNNINNNNTHTNKNNNE